MLAQVKATVWQRDGDDIRPVEVTRVVAMTEPLVISSVELLTLDEVARALKVEDVVKPKAAHLRTRHHEIARLMALGRSAVEISAVMGISPNSIYMIKGNPAFQELLAYYMGERDKAVRDVTGRIESIAMTGLDRLQDFLESPDAAPGFVRAVVADLLDRAGHSPVKKKEVRAMHTVLTSDDLKEIRNANGGAQLRQAAPTIDLTPAGPDDSGASVGGTGEEGSEVLALPRS